jgi:hypothetical protein
MVDGYAAVGGMRNDKGNLLQLHFVHHKSHISASATAKPTTALSRRYSKIW